MTDPVNPAHYAGEIECIDVIEQQQLGYHLGNVVKYIWRHDKKGKIEDIKKAKWYLDRYLESKQ